MTRNVNTPENATSEKKCAPPAMRCAPAASPNRIAAPKVTGSHAAGTTAAGANDQNAPEPSPATNEQFLSQEPRGSHHGMNFSVPPSCVTSPGRGRCQLSFSITLV